MLQFFRRYQKFFFMIVTFGIIISFTFFGTYNVIGGEEKIPDKEIGKLVDGSPLTQQKLFGLIRLLEHGIEEGGRNANLLCDSLVHRDLLLTGLGEILADHHFELCKEEFSERWVRLKNYIPYVHPYVSQINAQNIWDQMAPEINEILAEIKAAPNEFSKEQLPLLFKLYVAQADFPPPLLLQMLYYQQSQLQIRQDPGLPNANLALCGFESVEDWFGHHFVTELGKFILNVAILAKEKGYVVDKGQAQIDLVQNVSKGLKMFGYQEKLSDEQIHNTYQNQLRHIGLSEAKAIEYWRQVLLFHRFFEEVGEGVFVDRLALEQFKQYTSPVYSVTRYMLPEALQTNRFLDMLKMQRYFEIVFEEDVLDIPKKQKDSESIRDSHPQLVYKPFDVRIASTSMREVAAEISLKQTWQWQTEDEGYALLEKEFPTLARKKCSSPEERMQNLDAQPPTLRRQIDFFSRLELAKNHPEWIDEKLANTERKEKTLQVHLQGGDPNFSGAHFLALLETEDPSLFRYTQDNETFYAIEVTKKYPGWQVISLEDAMKGSVLDTLLDSLLYTAYEQLDFEDDYEDVKEEVAETVYTDLLRSIGSYEDLDQYAEHRFDRYLDQMRMLAMQDLSEFETKNSKSVWPLKHFEDQVRSEKISYQEGECSLINRGGFFKCLSKTENVAEEKEMNQIKMHLKQEAQRAWMRKMLTRV